MYHMIDYIHEEPTALRRTLEESDAVVETLVAGVRDRRWDRLIVVGVGSSYTAALMALPAFRLHSPIPVEVLPSTELGPYRDRWLGPRTLVISVSRSGERGWVVDEQRAARVAGSYTVAMSGVADSLLALEADLLLPTAEGPEITFSKTKSVITCAGLLMNLAFRLASSLRCSTERSTQLRPRSPRLPPSSMPLTASISAGRGAITGRPSKAPSRSTRPASS
jgi:glucosamine--fructose-6-phosphate aminotransferase (isomerizing)